MTTAATRSNIVVSIGILAHNEARAIGAALESLFRQSLFAELHARGEVAEILCVVNGSTDATAEIAARHLEEASLTHPYRAAFTAGVTVVEKAGKINAWNLFVHRLSARGAECLIFMDADIVFGHITTLWNLRHGLERQPDATVSVGEPIKELALKKHPTLRGRFSLAASRMTQGASAQLTGQLYCIRTATARRVRLPKDLPACEDGFIKCLVCTDFGTKESQASRIVRVRDASHIFEAYVSFRDILRNQKRQIMGQTFVHVIVDRFLPTLPPADRADPAKTVHRLDRHYPSWLPCLVREHLQRTRWFWRLFPGMLTFRFRRLALLPGWRKVTHLPVALAGFAVTITASWLAARALRRGEVRYWPGKGAVQPADGHNLTRSSLTDKTPTRSQPWTA